MSNSKKRGIRIGHYRITPLGIGAAIAILLIIALVVLLTTGGMDKLLKATIAPAASPTPTAAPTAEPTAKPTPTASPEPTATPEPEPRSARIRMLGEIMMELELLKSGYNETDKTFNFNEMFSLISDITADADYTIADVEGSMGNTDNIGADEKRCHTPVSLLGTLADAGVDMLMLANEHALDVSYDELKDAMTNISVAGLDYVGAAASAEERATPVVKDINGIKVGFAAYAEPVDDELSEEARAYGISLISNSNAPEDIKALRQAGAEIVIVLTNWGEKFTHEPNSMQEKIAQVLVNAGADVILGYHPHAVQPVAWLEGTVDGQPHRTLCLWSAGNLLSDQRKTGTNCGVIFEFTLKEQEDGSIAVEAPQYIPTYVLRYQDAAGTTQYRTVSIGRYTGEGAALADGMSAADVEYMKELESAIQAVIGNAAVMIAE